MVGLDNTLDICGFGTVFLCLGHYSIVEIYILVHSFEFTNDFEYIDLNISWLGKTNWQRRLILGSVGLECRGINLESLLSGPARLQFTAAQFTAAGVVVEIECNNLGYIFE